MKFLLSFCLVLSCALPVLAEEGHHHEELTAEQLGTVHFPVSCAPSVQASFGRGVALLHSFWYEQAETTFQQVAKDDPQCAMAHWGVAMSVWHQLWNHPDAATVKRGETEAKMADAFHPKTGRERDYVAAVNAFYSGPASRKYQTRASAYAKAMQKVYEHNPDDHEGAAFYALSLLASEPEHDTTNVNRKKAAQVLEKVFAAEPNHPGIIHYLIHAYDAPDMASLGLPAARRYAQIAPASPHALHMPSHIFARLGIWPDDISSNVASIAASHKYAEMGGEGHEFHAMDFLFYAYLQSGREAMAQHMIEEVRVMPVMKDMYGMGYDPHISTQVVFEAMYPLELHHWKEAAELALVPGASNEDNAITHWARAIGFANLDQHAKARKEVEEIGSLRRNADGKKHLSREHAITQDEKEAAAWAEFAEGRKDHALTALRELAQKDAGAYQALDLIPARELLASMLAAMSRWDEALTEYEVDLKTNPNRFDALYGAAVSAKLAGKNGKAVEYYSQLVKNCEGSGTARPEVAEAKAWLASEKASAQVSGATVTR